jgi:hypothetical protein
MVSGEWIREAGAREKDEACGSLSDQKRISVIRDQRSGSEGKADSSWRPVKQRSDEEKAEVRSNEVME